MALYRQNNYRKLYSDASEEIIAVLKQSDRRMEYDEYDRKAERSHTDAKTGAVTFIPSKEDSLDRLLELDVQFRAEQEDVDEVIIKRLMLDKLHHCLTLLPAKELELVNALFFNEMSERQLSEQTGIPPMTIHNRKIKILCKLKKMIEM